MTERSPDRPKYAWPGSVEPSPTVIGGRLLGRSVVDEETTLFTADGDDAGGDEESANES